MWDVCLPYFNFKGARYFIVSNIIYLYGSLSSQMSNIMYLYGSLPTNYYDILYYMSIYINSTRIHMKLESSRQDPVPMTPLLAVGAYNALSLQKEDVFGQCVYTCMCLSEQMYHCVCMLLFYIVLRPVKIISLILSRLNR